MYNGSYSEEPTRRGEAVRCLAAFVLMRSQEEVRHKYWIEWKKALRKQQEQWLIAKLNSRKDDRTHIKIGQILLISYDWANNSIQKKSTVELERRSINGSNKHVW